MYQCPICFESFNQLLQVDEHIERSHLSITILEADKTNEYIELRQKRMNEIGLQKLVVEKRFNKLISFVRSNEKEVTHQQFEQFEKTIVDWNNDQKECKICQVRFSWFNRKHHCRICGNTVCDDLQRGCSMNVPISIIMEIFGLQNNWEFSIRICKHCKKLAISKRIFEKDRNSQELLFVKFWKRWKLVSEKIDQLDLTVIRDNSENDLFVSLFTKLDNLIKEVDHVLSKKNEILSEDEYKMLKNLKNHVFTYIQKNLPILRKAQERKLMDERKILQKLTSKPKLTKIEIQNKREKLMVLNEQKFLVEEMYREFKKQRRFDDLITLDSNLLDIQKEIDQLVIELGDESF
ncbi:hypothetical protein CANINC_003780 [Pichia inconspicua]|uniref:FYVE-type domain-containing protein n=1 Tax=Pichia inconspicua TaxID=52247 RepID=A0A4T0WXS0_9ASCO|nr:hypothetical protein CANINC_003780 [[Candida] inconspicua]